MDQDASNNPGKPSWREKLGLGSGSKEMPKISNEFRAGRADLKGEPAAEVRGPQPVTKLAPMAPRPQPPAQSGKPPILTVASNNPLADRLKAQRQAAEKLAEQRVSAARSSAGGEPRGRPEAPPQKPRFTFAEEELAQAKRETPAEPKHDFQPSFPPKHGNGNANISPLKPPVSNPPLVPPRPALGGERPINPAPSDHRQPTLPQLSQRFQGTRPQPSGYRSIDPPTYQPQPPQPRRASQRGQAYQPSFGNGSYPEGAGAPRGYEGYRRRPAQEPQNAEENHYSPRQRRAAAVPARGRQPAAYDEDMGEVFEEEAPASRRRASAQDYHQAYREYDERYESEQRRRSSGPWLIALVLFLVAIAATAGWYYFYVMKPGQSASGEVPVIAAPDKPAKTEPEAVQPTGSTIGSSSNQGDSSTDRRKQIYDRVMGDESVGGTQIVPTQESPQQVEPSGDQPQQQQMQNDQSAPKASGEGTGATSNESVDPLPLPLPPPPGSSNGEQGSLDSSTSSATVSANMPSQESRTVAEPTAASEIIAPVPGETPEKVAAEASPPEAAQPAEEADVQPIEPPAKPTVTATMKPKVQPAPKKTASVESENIESPEPLVLVPPQTTQAVGETTALPAPVTQNPQKQSGSFFNFNNTGKKRLTGKRAEQPDFSNSNMINSGPKSLPADATDASQVAAISPSDQTQPLPMPTPQESDSTAQGVTTGGYVAQLASFRSEAEAMAEYDRLRSKYSDVVGGLAPRVTKASVSGATRYRLGVGPVASREAASRICNSLIAAGERDCLVRGN